MPSDSIDTQWFLKQLALSGKSQSGLARALGLDKSAVSRLLKGERKMSADEQDEIAAFLSVALNEVAVHRRSKPSGFSEEKQAAYQPDPKPDRPQVEMFSESDIIFKDGKRWMEMEDGVLLELHPAFGCMKGTMTIPDDLDLTAPVDPDWGKVYDDD